MDIPDEPILRRQTEADPEGEAAEPGLAERIGRLMREQPYGVLCTQGQTQPYGSLVAFAAGEDLCHAVFSTLTSTRKYRLLSQCRRISLVVDSRANNPGSMLEIEAVTATGEVSELCGDAARTWAERLTGRHPALRAFVAAPTCALFRIDIARYFHVVRFQEVRQWVPASAG